METGIEVLVPPTAEMTRWRDRLDRLVFAGQSIAARAIRTALVTPLAHVSPMSLEFQSYLYAVFHRTALARAAHLVCMPLIVTATIGAAVQLSPWLGAVTAGALAGYYAMVAIRHRLQLLALAMMPITLALGILGVEWAAASSFGSNLWLSPAVWLVGLSLVQTLSHALEHVPPRVSGGSDWITVREFFLGCRAQPHSATQFGARLIRGAGMTVAGTFNELTGSWRLLTTLVLRGMWRLGYAPERRARLAALVDAATRDDNPAVDYIGTGGTRFHH